MEYISKILIISFIVGLGIAITAFIASAKGDKTPKCIHASTLILAVVALILNVVSGIEQSKSEADSKQVAEIRHSQLTGGNSYATLYLSIATNDTMCSGVIYNHGSNTIYDLDVRILNLSEMDTMDPFLLIGGGTFSMDQTFKTGDIKPDSYAYIEELELNLESRPTNLKVFFSARNGRWDQITTLTKNNTKWENSYFVEREGTRLYSSENNKEANQAIEAISTTPKN